MIRLSARDDLCLVLDFLRELQNEFHFELFDNIQIHRSGINLIRIKNKLQESGCSVFIEINDYRRRV